MRISSNYYSTLYNTSMMNKSQDQSGISNLGSSRNDYDEITIHSSYQEDEDSNFISNLKAAVVKEVKQPTSENKLDTLKQKIQEGSYQVDANKIAERILSYKGESLNE